MRTLTCRAKYDRQPVTTQDGGTVALDWFQPRGLDKIPSDAPIVLILHGLTGDWRVFCVQRKLFCTNMPCKVGAVHVQLNSAFSTQYTETATAHC